MADDIKDDNYWKDKLTKEEFKITRKKGTERAFTGKYNDLKESGLYVCKCCDSPLFSSESKYDSGSGWPSYFQPYQKENISEKEDSSFFMKRTEVLCAKCNAHLGHVFPDGPQPTGLRYCINSLSLNFEPSSED